MRNTPLSHRSTVEVERLARDWAQHGLKEIKHILDPSNRRIITANELRQQHPDIDVKPLELIQKKSRGNGGKNSGGAAGNVAKRTRRNKRRSPR